MAVWVLGSVFGGEQRGNICDQRYRLFFRVGFDLEYENTLTGKTYPSEQEYRIE